VYAPETSSRTFRSAQIQLTWRCASTSASNFTGWRVGITLGAAATYDVDYSPTAQGNTGDHECSFFVRDVTKYFNDNFGAGSSQTCAVGFAMSQAAIRAVNNITCKLILTYEYDDSGLTTAIKTVRIPIQSHHELLTNAQQEIGTTGGTNNAPVNQIPLLDTFLPEASKTVRQAFIEMYANEGSATGVDYNAFLQVDAVAEVTRATLEAALTTGTFYHDIYIYDTGTHVTSAAHAFKMRALATARFDCAGAVLVVTYEYNASTTTTVLNSLVLSLDNRNMGMFVNGTTAADQDVLSTDIWVEEPGIITLKQSGVLMWMHAAGAATVNVAANNQTSRAYTITAVAPTSGDQTIIHRVDHSSGWTLGRGKNTLLLKLFTSTAATAVINGAVVYLNYTSSKATPGIGSHNHSTCWSIGEFPTTGAAAATQEILTTASGTTIPNIPEDKWVTNNVTFEVFDRCAAASQTIGLSIENLAGEFYGDGWSNPGTVYRTTDGELSTYCSVINATELFNRFSTISGSLSSEGTRKYRLQTDTAALTIVRQWITHNSLFFTVSGTIVGYTGGGSDVEALVYSRGTNVLVASGISIDGGYYTATVPDSNYPHFVAFRQDAVRMGRSDDGTPE